MSIHICFLVVFFTTLLHITETVKTKPKNGTNIHVVAA